MNNIIKIIQKQNEFSNKKHIKKNKTKTNTTKSKTHKKIRIAKQKTIVKHIFSLGKQQFANAKQQRKTISGNMFIPFIKLSNLHVNNAITRQQTGVISRNMRNLFM